MYLVDPVSLGSLICRILTRQSTLEDEEEQEREHQWQHQNLSFAMDDKDPPDPESTSMRLPASSVKLGQKLEQYLSAIQRSESVKCANPSCTDFLEAPVDVTSMRHLFENELVGQSREGPASRCKENLELSGLVKSQLNLWISRIQESAQQGPQNQETQRELAAGRKPQWRKKPEAPLGTKPTASGKTLDPEASLDPETPSPSKCSVPQKISVLEERAVSGKREVPDKASDSEKRPTSEKATVFKKTPVPEIQPAPGRAMAPLRPQDWEHSASAECPSSPGGQWGTGPEKEPESSAGPLSRDGGLPPVTLQVGPSCVSPPCLLCCPQDRGLGWDLTWHPHHTLIPGPDSRKASDASGSHAPAPPLEALSTGLALGLWLHPHS
ncbi:hypothetical protein E5288_WYG015784 [Bos mutus]|uniref:Uncharacterized protein n=1 Tax=Bos mutus TaxID=72004 RepID=A0A6B0SCD4_9CETA|nr:hypothetical protein [Bos mutus]